VVWSFGILIFAQLQISFQLVGYYLNGFHLKKTVSAIWDGVTPVEAKLLAAVLIVFLLLFVWRKSRPFASGVLLVVVFIFTTCIRWRSDLSRPLGE